MIRNLARIGLILLVMGFCGFSSAILAQNTPVDPTPEVTQAVISVDPTPAPDTTGGGLETPEDEIPENLGDFVSIQVLVGLLMLGAVLLVVSGAVIVWVTRYVSRLIPADLIPTLYQGVDTVYARRNDLVNSLSEAAQKTASPWDNTIIETAKRVTYQQWQEYRKEAAARGVILPAMPPQVTNPPPES